MQIYEMIRTNRRGRLSAYNLTINAQGLSGRTIKRNQIIGPTHDPVPTLNGAMGHIRGKVVDCNGKVLPGCRIWLRETGQHAYSDNKGDFIMINIQPAIHTIVVEHKRYSPSIFPDVRIEAGDNPGFRFVMHPCTIPEDKLRITGVGKVSLMRKVSH